MLDLARDERQNAWKERLQGEPASALKRAEEVAHIVQKEIETIISSDPALLQKLPETNQLRARENAIRKEMEVRLAKSLRLLEKLPLSTRLALREVLKDYEVGRLGDERTKPPEERFSGYPELHMVWEELCISAAMGLIRHVEHAADHMLDLWGEIVQGNVPKQAAVFLKLVSRCYIWGFAPECVILCRSALERAIDKCVPNVSGLQKQIDAAFDKGIIDKATQRLAHDVRIRGIKAVHYDPQATQDVLGTIRDTLTVIKRTSVK
jgi:hypothetical protein